MSNVTLVLFAHGSKDPRWRAPFEKLTSELQVDLGKDQVRLAYMEFASPGFLEVARDLVGCGVTRVRLLPLFLAAGSHVANDIPRQVDAVQKEFPDLRIEVLPPIGEDPRFARLIREIARERAS